MRSRSQQALRFLINGIAVVLGIAGIIYLLTMAIAIREPWGPAFLALASATEFYIIHALPLLIPAVVIAALVFYFIAPQKQSLPQDLKTSAAEKTEPFMTAKTFFLRTAALLAGILLLLATGRFVASWMTKGSEFEAFSMLALDTYLVPILPIALVLMLVCTLILKSRSG